MKGFWSASSVVLAAALATTTSSTAWAQNATPDASAPGSANPQNPAPQAADSAAPRAEDIIVTATRRDEKLNRVPIAIQALSGKMLEQLNVTNFEKLVEYLPDVRTASRGPGISSIYIRGLSTDTPGAQIEGVAGQQPTVALYLNDAPASTPGRNLDIHPTDLNRIEVLAGPQGTLFGASAMGGAIRYITNKPDLSAFHMGFTGSFSTTKHGADSIDGEGFINIPIIKDKLAARIVIYDDNQGGYIDNVPGTYQMPFNSGGPGQIPTGNPVLVSHAIASCVGVTNCVGTPTGTSGGFLAPITQSISNTAFVAPHYNDANYAGGRIELAWQVSDSWSIEAMGMHQALKTDGVFDYAPGVGDLEVQQYSPNTLRDTTDMATLTLKGRLSILDMIYTSAYLDHHSVQQADYAKYDNIGLYIPYYNCDAGVYSNNPSKGNTCYSPSNNYKIDDRNRRWTQEFRITTPADKPIRGTFGAFYDVNRLYDDTQWNYVLPAAGYIYSLAPSVLTNVLGLGAQPVGTGFVNDVLRRDRQFAAYGEASWDIIPKKLTATGGVRYYSEDAYIKGGSNSSFGGVRENCDSVSMNAEKNTTCNYTPLATTPTNLGTSVNFITPSIIKPPVLAGIDPKTFSGAILKGNLTYKFTPDQLLYVTYSEGYRPGGFNRKGCNDGQTLLPASTCKANLAYEPDNAKNYEIGTKLGLFDHQLQVNLAAYIINWTGIQMSVFDQNISNQTFIANLANARIHGLEGDITWRPVHGLTIGSGFSYNDSKLNGYVAAQQSWAHQVLVPLGSPLALSPKFQGNIRARYEWQTQGDLKPFVAAGFHFVGSTISSDLANTSILYGGKAATINGVNVTPGTVITPIVNSFNQPAYHTLEASFGFAKDLWNVEFFGENLGDARPQLFTSGNDGETRVTTSRPRTFGVRFSYKM